MKTIELGMTATEGILEAPAPEPIPAAEWSDRAPRIDQGFAALLARHDGLSTAEEIMPSANGHPPAGQQALVFVPKLNTVEDLSRFFEMVNERLTEGGLFAGTVESISQRKRRLSNGTTGLRAQVRWQVDFFVHRVLPRLPFTGRVYSALQKSPNRAVSLTETLGRLVHAGFEVVDLEEGGPQTAFVVRRVAPPLGNGADSIGIVFRMERVGRNDETIRVFKLRTMHPYAQYLQEYIFQGQSVASAGKFRNDFRVTRWGQFLRRHWIDELPMLLNWLMGDLKLFGVRPLSRHYLSLYPADLRESRSRHTPGLIPPYYADLPSGLDAIWDSERRYLAAYERHPIRTDIRYFAKAMWNIVARSARSS